MHLLVSFRAALAQDADAIDDDVDAGQQRTPWISTQHLLEARDAAFASMRLHRKTTRGALGCRLPITTRDAREPRRDRITANESRSAEHENVHPRR